MKVPLAAVTRCTTSLRSNSSISNACRPGLRLELHKLRKVSMHGNVNVSVRHTVDGSSFDDWVGHIRDQHTMRSCRATRMSSGTLQCSTRRAPMIISTTDVRRRSRSASATAAVTVTRCTLHNVPAHPGGSRRPTSPSPNLRPQATTGPRDAFHRHSGRKQSCRTRSQLAVASTPQVKVEAPHVVVPTAIEHRGFRCGAVLRRSRQQSAVLERHELHLRFVRPTQYAFGLPARSSTCTSATQALPQLSPCRDGVYRSSVHGYVFSSIALTVYTVQGTQQAATVSHSFSCNPTNKAATD